ncbi:MAG: hypothetical protein JRJ19_03120 [Deltaproteobacteria bacterium]|nr:hypothetical protein [Deltaproteobacteria bacterium]MBW1871025.1 hypothetical protein [Deltaproteobacteria bacterium]
MKKHEVLEAFQSGEVSIREMKGITTNEMKAAIKAGRTLMQAGEYQAAAEVLSGLALYDPFLPDVWLAIEELFRRESRPQQAALFGDIARIMAAGAY